MSSAVSSPGRLRACLSNRSAGRSAGDRVGRQHAEDAGRAALTRALLLIVAVIGTAIALWQGGAATVGTVAAASALTLRLNAMTGWIMWSLSSLFQNIGVIREGMETIAQPIALPDAPDARRGAPLLISGAVIHTLPAGATFDLTSAELVDFVEQHPDVDAGLAAAKA